MAYRFDLPRIRPTEAPSLFNREAGIGAYLGTLVAGVATAFVVTAIGTPLLAAVPIIAAADMVGMVIGGLIGANKGKERQITEQQHGRVVKEPGYWNAGIVNGMAAVNLVTIPLSLMGVFLPVLNIPLTIGGMMIGSVIRKTNLDHDLETAIRMQEQEHHVERIRRQETGRGPAIYKDSVSAQEAALLEEKLVDKAGSHVADQAQRAASAEQLAQSARA